MNSITIMTDDLANKIAAGEVIEKTYNVVKELVENAIDAGASEINIKLATSGIKEIIVSDNGKGMSRNDALLSFERHATSKLKDLDDLFSIESLGFRGEALPSIASVSRVKLNTYDGSVATTLEVENGKVNVTKSGPMEKGTTIVVSDLFYNTPVRLKYLKNEYAELANITDYVSKMALSFPSIRFTLSNDKKEIINTDGTGNLLKTISKIYSIDIAKKMIEVDSQSDDYRISGFISYPEITKSNRNSINLFINGRYIKNNELNRYIIDSYHGFLPIDKYPIIVLNIEVDPRLIDVNIHPTKLDIKFSKMDSLKTLITKTIKHKLETLNLIPEIKTLVKEEEEIYMPLREDKSDKEESSLEEVIDPIYEEISLELGIEPLRTEIKAMTPVGLAHGTYIIAENSDGMYIIDQHAAAERINYEFYMKEMGKETLDQQVMLIPYKLELPADEYIILKSRISHFENLGFSIEDFGINTILVREHPTWLKEEYLSSAIDKIAELIIRGDDFDKARFIERVAITVACKISIKANEHMTIENMQDLLDRLLQTENPFTCPHGRPTIISYSKYELEKLFKRAMN